MGSVTNCQLAEIVLLKVLPGTGSDLKSLIERHFGEKCGQSRQFFWSFSGVDLVAISYDDSKRDLKEFFDRRDIRNKVSIYNHMYGFRLLNSSMTDLQLNDNPIVGVCFLKLNSEIMRNTGFATIERFFIEYLCDQQIKCELLCDIGWAGFILIMSCRKFEDLLIQCKNLRNCSCDSTRVPLFSSTVTLPGCSIDIADSLNRVEGEITGVTSFSCSNGDVVNHYNKLMSHFEKDIIPKFCVNDFMYLFQKKNAQEVLENLLNFYLAEDSKIFSGMSTRIGVEPYQIFDGESSSSSIDLSNMLPIIESPDIDHSLQHLGKSTNSGIRAIFSTFNEQLSRDSTADSFEDMYLFMSGLKKEIEIINNVVEEDESIPGWRARDEIHTAIDVFNFANLQRCKGVLSHTLLSYPYILEFQGGLQKLLKVLDYIIKGTLKRFKPSDDGDCPGISLIGYCPDYQVHLIGDNNRVFAVNVPVSDMLAPGQWPCGLAHEIGHICYNYIDHALIDFHPEMVPGFWPKYFPKIQAIPSASLSWFQRLLEEIYADIFALKYGNRMDWETFFPCFWRSTTIRGSNLELRIRVLCTFLYYRESSDLDVEMIKSCLRVCKDCALDDELYTIINNVCDSDSPMTDDQLSALFEDNDILGNYVRASFAAIRKMMDANLFREIPDSFESKNMALKMIEGKIADDPCDFPLYVLYEIKKWQMSNKVDELSPLSLYHILMTFYHHYWRDISTSLCRYSLSPTPCA